MHPPEGGFYTLDSWEIDRIVDTVGGHLKDIDTVVTSIARGRRWAPALERLVADSVEAVERVLDDILHADAATLGGSGGGGGSTTNRRPASGGATSAIARANRASLSRDYPLPPFDYQSTPTPERLAALCRYLRTWALVCELAGRKYVSRRELAARIFAECPHELEFLADAGLIMAVNVKSATKLHASIAVQHPAGGGTAAIASPPSAPPSTSFDTSHPGVYVSASSPRMRVAFRALVADARLQSQTARVRAAVEVALLRSRERELLARLPEASAERSFAAGQLQVLLVRDSALRAALAKELMMAATTTAAAAAGGGVTSSSVTDAAATAAHLPLSSSPYAAAVAAAVAAPHDHHAPALFAGGYPASAPLPVGTPNLGLAAAIADAHAHVAALDTEVATLRASLRRVRSDLESQLAVCASTGTLALAGASGHFERYAGVISAASAPAASATTAAAADAGVAPSASAPAQASGGSAGLPGQWQGRLAPSSPSPQVSATSFLADPLLLHHSAAAGAAAGTGVVGGALARAALAPARASPEEDLAIDRYIDGPSSSSSSSRARDGDGGGSGESAYLRVYGRSGDGDGHEEDGAAYAAYAWPPPSPASEGHAGGGDGNYQPEQLQRQQVPPWVSRANVFAAAADAEWSHFVVGGPAAAAASDPYAYTGSSGGGGGDSGGTGAAGRASGAPSPSGGGTAPSTHRSKQQSHRAAQPHGAAYRRDSATGAMVPRPMAGRSPSPGGGGGGSAGGSSRSSGQRPAAPSAAGAGRHRPVFGRGGAAVASNDGAGGDSSSTSTADGGGKDRRGRGWWL